MKGLANVGARKAALCFYVPQVWAGRKEVAAHMLSASGKKAIVRRTVLDDKKAAVG